MSFGIIAGGIATGLGAGATTAAVVGGVASAGGQYLKARQGAKAAESAAQAQAGAQQAGADLIYKQFQETKEMLQPYSDLGLPAAQEQQALLGLAGEGAQTEAMSRFQESPGYRFRLERGLGAVDQGYTAGGALVSGAREKARMKFAGGEASNEFANYWNRLGSQAGLGLSATEAITGRGAAAASGQAGYVSDAGRSVAGGIQSKAKEYQSGFDSAVEGIGKVYEKYYG
jgi:hypothetical protein